VVLRDCLASVPPGRVELCPVPPSRRSWRRRGYDPVRMLVRHAGLRAPRLLRVSRRGGAQKALGVDARAANAAGSLRARRPLPGRRVILVDDVVTSGATLGEAARAVRAAGGEVLAAVALASTPRRNGRGCARAGDGQ
jgi:predicted amidophosphoribosyltransferase